MDVCELKEKVESSEDNERCSEQPHPYEHWTKRYADWTDF
jgi:hypothetical protein